MATPSGSPSGSAVLTWPVARLSWPRRGVRADDRAVGPFRVDLAPERTRTSVGVVRAPVEGDLLAAVGTGVRVIGAAPGGRPRRAGAFGRGGAGEAVAVVRGSPGA